MKRILAKTWKWFFLGLFAAWAIAACSNQQQATQQQPSSIMVEDPLPQIEKLAKPSLPAWIEEIHPVGQAEPLSQIRIRFQDPLIPVEALDADTTQEKLKHFEISPDLPGRFRFLTPKMVGFQADRALPNASRVRVTIKSGLSDLQDRTLNQDLAWTFETNPIQLTNLPSIKPNPYSEPQFIDLEPKLEFTSNVELDQKSLQKHAQLVSIKDDTIISLNASLLTKDNPRQNLTPQEKFDPSKLRWRYQLEPKQKLQKGTEYRLEFTSGLEPKIGNLASQTKFTSNVKTYEQLAFEELQYFGQPNAGGAYGRFQKGGAELKFNNGLAAESAEKHIRVTNNQQKRRGSAPVPAPSAPVPALTGSEDLPLVRAYQNSDTVEINPWALEPATNYTITVEKGLKDRYGQTLEEDVEIEYSTGDLAADIWAPSGTNIFPAAEDLQLNIFATNLPRSQYQAAYQVVQPEDLIFTDSAYPQGEQKDLLPQKQNWSTFDIQQQKNEKSSITVPIKERLGGETGMLAYGVTARTNQYETEDGGKRWREPDFYGLVQLTNLGVWAQVFPESSLVRVHHLDDGSPVANAAVEVYPSKLFAGRRSEQQRLQPEVCAEGTTDSTGTLKLDQEALSGCMPQGRFDEAPELLFVARENQDWAYARIQSYSGAYGYGANLEWNEGSPQSRGTIFSDRKLYQPGETAHFTGVAAYLDDGELALDKNTRYTVTLQDREGNKEELGSYTTNDLGTFSVDLPIAEDRSLGFYTLQARSQRGVEIRGEFRVAEFNPPNFKVDVAVDSDYVQFGDTLTAQVNSEYLFGAPVAEGNATYYVTRSQKSLQPNQWEEFQFGRQWFFPEESPTVDSQVLEKQAVLNESGEGSFEVKVDEDLPYPMQYRLEAEVSDVSNLSVANSQTVTVLPSDRMIGLRSNFVADAQSAFDTDVIVTNPQGDPISGEKVRLELQKMNYSSVTEVVAGSRNPRYQVEYETVDTQQVRSGNEPKTVSLTAPSAGSYRIRANFANATDEVTATDRRMWVSGGGMVSWRSQDDMLQVNLDRDTYAPGDTAKALIQSPYEKGEIYFSVVRDEPLYEKVVSVEGSAPQVAFQVTEEMLPNAAVEAVLVRQGEPLGQSNQQPQDVEDLVKVGFAPFKVGLDQKYLQVDLQHAEERQPGDEQTIDLQVRSHTGEPVQGQVALMVANESVLQLSGYRPPDLVETVYAEQPISTRFRDNRFDVVLQPFSSPMGKGWGYGGGMSAAAADTDLRTAFQPLAYYNGAIATDENGRAQVSFDLPDNLTTWRVMAVAMAEPSQGSQPDMRFGKEDSTFMVTQPLVTNPILPRFVRPGDRFMAGVSVTNNTGRDRGELDIEALLQGDITFADEDMQETLQRDLPSGTAGYRLEMVAQNPENRTATGGEVRFTTQLQRGASDAWEVSLPVEPLQVSESVVQTGQTRDRATVPVNVSDDVVPSVGGLEITLASTLVPELKAPAAEAFDDDVLPFLEPTASQLAIASSLQILGEAYNQSFVKFSPQKEGNQALQQLKQLQLSDGGFATYPGDETSDPFVTPYAAQSLAVAQKAGLSVSSEMVSQVRAYLKTLLADPSGKYEFCSSQSCKNRVRLGALVGLDALGERRGDFLGEIYQGRAELDTVAQIRLARHMAKFDQWQNEAENLVQQLQQTVYETGSSATLNLPQGWSWLSTPTVAQAEALRLFLNRDTQPEVVNRLLQGLLDLRRNGTWQTTYADAAALQGLVEYSQTWETDADFEATVMLNGEVLDKAQFTSGSDPLSINVAMDRLSPGEQDLVIEKRGEGTLHYAANYSYRLQGSQPGRFNGLRVSREIRPAGEESVLQRVGLSEVEPLEVNAGEVFDVGLEIVTDHPVNHVTIKDFLPAGFEAVDTSFQTATEAVATQASSWQIGYQQLYDDRVVAYGDRLTAGVYHLHYLVRSVTPGTFEFPGAEVRLQYTSSEFGRSSSSKLVVKE